MQGGCPPRQGLRWRGGAHRHSGRLEKAPRTVLRRGSLIAFRRRSAFAPQRPCGKVVRLPVWWCAGSVSGGERPGLGFDPGEGWSARCTAQQGPDTCSGWARAQARLAEGDREQVLALEAETNNARGGGWERIGRIGRRWGRMDLGGAWRTRACGTTSRGPSLPSVAHLLLMTRWALIDGTHRG